MANAAALIRESLWRDRDFRKLPRSAQCTYQQLLAQKDLDCAGVLTLHLELLAKGCDELTVDELRLDFAVLEHARFIFVDEDTDELLIRTYVRTVSAKSPNAWKSAKKAALLVESPKIRRELASELRRIGRSDASEIADQLNPSETHPKPIQNPSEGDNPLGGDSEPPSSVPVVGHLTSVVASLGGEPPPRFCPKHPNGTNENCWACGQRRKARDAFDAEQEQLSEMLTARLRAEAEARQRACPHCDEYGWLLDTAEEEAIRCNHQGETDVG